MQQTKITLPYVLSRASYWNIHVGFDSPAKWKHPVLDLNDLGYIQQTNKILFKRKGPGSNPGSRFSHCCGVMVSTKKVTCFDFGSML